MLIQQTHPMDCECPSDGAFAGAIGAKIGPDAATAPQAVVDLSVSLDRPAMSPAPERPPDGGRDRDGQGAACAAGSDDRARGQASRSDGGVLAPSLEPLKTDGAAGPWVGGLLCDENEAVPFVEGAGGVEAGEGRAVASGTV